MSKQPRRIAMIDTETTGLSPETDRIVELAVVIGKHGQVEEQHSWLINPGIPIPAEASAVHHITDEDVANEPSFAEVADDFLQVIENCYLAAYNAPYDKQMLLAELQRAGKADALPDEEWLDPLVWVKEIQKYESGKKLEQVTERLGIELGDAHRAGADAEAALKVLFVLSRDQRVPKTFRALIDWQKQVAEEQRASYERWKARQGQ